MTVWFRRSAGIDSKTMREIASNADVSWSADPIVYRQNGVGYADGDSSDVTALQDAAESLLGFRPGEIDSPAKTDNTQ